MDEQAVKDLVAQAVKESLTAENLGPVIKETMEAEGFVAGELDTTDDDDSDDETPAPENEELTAVKSDLEATKGKIEELETGINTLLERIPASAPRAIKGQDNEGGTEKSQYEPKRQRDAMGRPIPA